MLSGYNREMPRTTLDIDGPVLRELKALRRQEKRSLGKIASQLLAEALATRKGGKAARAQHFSWIARPMKALVDISDKDALHAALDREVK
jgi:hypothetical protein